MNELALYAGAGGGLLATQHLLGFRTICYVENGDYPVKVLKARIRDELLDDAPIWGDIRTFDGKPWRGCVDLLTAGFPCQPWATGGKGRGAHDDRNLWPDTLRVIGEVRPTWILLENSPRLLQVSHKWGRPPYIQQIIGDLALLGYVGRYGCLSAAALGFGHKRRRLWVVAHASGQGRQVFLCDHTENGPARDAQEALETATLVPVWDRLAQLEERLGQPSVFGVNDGLPDLVAQLAAAGEAQVPAVVATAWNILSKGEGR